MDSKLVLYNTLTRRKEEFEPLTPGRVGMYVCGPTVYGDPHLGHARPAVTFDLLFRYLKACGYKVRYVRNITDVDDKIIRRAAERGITTTELTEEFGRAMQEDMLALGCLAPTHEPRATDYIPEMLGLIEKLEQKGYAYQGSDGDVDFAVRKFENYGRLSGKSIDDLQSGARVDVAAGKRDPLDFVLWKSAKPGEPQWESKWGCGRPGWHIECSAMSRTHLGKTIDLHCGGQDLIFPHHENEIAQSECANGCEFARYWMHNGFINVDNQKMSKSLHNFFTVRDVADLYGYEPIRYFMLTAGYRMPLNYTVDLIESCKNSLERLYTCRENLDFALSKSEFGTDETLTVKAEEARKKFCIAMDDDLNSPIVIAHLFDAARAINSVKDGKATISAEDLKELQDVFHTFVFDILGIKDEATSGGSNNNEAFGKAMDLLLTIRQQAKANKDWATSDEIRNTLTALGFEIKDTKDGFEWRLNK